MSEQTRSQREKQHRVTKREEEEMLRAVTFVSYALAFGALLLGAGTLQEYLDNAQPSTEAMV